MIHDRTVVITIRDAANKIVGIVEQSSSSTHVSTKGAICRLMVLATDFHPSGKKFDVKVN